MANPKGLVENYAKLLPDAVNHDDGMPLYDPDKSYSAENYRLHPLQAEQIKTLMRYIVELNEAGGDIKLSISNRPQNGDLTITMRDKRKNVETSIEVQACCKEFIFMEDSEKYLSDADFSLDAVRSAGYKIRSINLTGTDGTETTQTIFTKKFGAMRLLNPDNGEETYYDFTGKVDEQLSLCIYDVSNDNNAEEIKSKLPKNFEVGLCSADSLMHNLAVKLQTLGFEEMRKTIINDMIPSDLRAN